MYFSRAIEEKQQKITKKNIQTKLILNKKIKTNYLDYLHGSPCYSI